MKSKSSAAATAVRWRIWERLTRNGFHLGEHNPWGKTSNFELDARAPFIIGVPGRQTKGGRTRALVEFVDIYPTLCELCELPAPPRLEGVSVVPPLRNPHRSWKRAAFTQFPRPNPSGDARKKQGGSRKRM